MPIDGIYVCKFYKIHETLMTGNKTLKISYPQNITQFNTAYNTAKTVSFTVFNLSSDSCFWDFVLLDFEKPKILN